MDFLFIILGTGYAYDINCMLGWMAVALAFIIFAENFFSFFKRLIESARENWFDHKE
jgi:hypothetical protein